MAETTPNPASLDYLDNMLESNGVSSTGWGRNGAKTLSSLLSELDNGEAMLVTSREGELQRQISALAVNVYHELDDGQLLKLKESKQVFADGTTRVRNLDSSVAEKLKTGEKPDETALLRALFEELGVDANGIEASEHIDTYSKTRESESYPGLPTQYLFNRFMVVLNRAGYDPEGYVEHQLDKSTYFQWQFVGDDA